MYFPSCLPCTVMAQEIYLISLILRGHSRHLIGPQVCLRVFSLVHWLLLLFPNLLSLTSPFTLGAPGKVCLCLHTLLFIPWFVRVPKCVSKSTQVRPCIHPAITYFPVLKSSLSPFCFNPLLIPISDLSVSVFIKWSLTPSLFSSSLYLSHGHTCVCVCVRVRVRACVCVRAFLSQTSNTVCMCVCVYTTIFGFLPHEQVTFDPWSVFFFTVIVFHPPLTSS